MKFALENPLRCAGVAALAFTLGALAASAQTYTFSVVYPFTGSGSTAANPIAAPVVDAAGNIFGVGNTGTTYGLGTVYELQKVSGGYHQITLHTFTQNYGDASQPLGPLVMDGAGNLYGTSSQGGTVGCGTVFKLTNSGGSYSWSVIHSFTSSPDGCSPTGALSVDASGNVYGTTEQGGTGAPYVGTVFELKPQGNGSYNVVVLHSFQGGSDGVSPEGGVILDSNGNLFGTTSGLSGNPAPSGGESYVSPGTVFELQAEGGGSFAFSTLYTFTGGSDGSNPTAAPTLDQNGNLLGTTWGENGGNGSVYELVKASGYGEVTLHAFTGHSDGARAWGPVTLDALGNVFGATVFGGAADAGTIFELVNPGGTYLETILYSFTTSAVQITPYSGVSVDSSGNLWGTSFGNQNSGSVWELQASFGTVTQLTASANPIFPGDTVTFTAAVTPSPATVAVSGTVTFRAGSAQLGTVTIANGSASISVPATALPIGTTTITAQFSPDSPALGSSGGTTLETVNSNSNVALTSGSNTFNGDQIVNGGLTASGGFFGTLNGNAATATTAMTLTCAGCVGDPQLGVNYAGSTAKGGPATTSLFANNAGLLGGFPAGSFATLDSNAFNGSQSISGGGLVLQPLGAASTGQGANSGAFDTTASSFNSSAGQPQNFVFRWQAEPAGNNTANPSATLNLLYGANGTPGETGLSVNGNGTLNFAPGQSFPGVGQGTITGVTAGSGLVGGGTAGAVSLSIPSGGVTNLMLANPSVGITAGDGLAGGGSVPLGGITTLSLAPNACPSGSAITSQAPFACSAFLTSGSSPSFATVTATAFSGGLFSGNGAGLTGVQAAGLAPSVSVPGTQVSGPVANATTAANLSGTVAGSQVSGPVANAAAAASLTGNIAESQVLNLQADLAAAQSGAAVIAYANSTFVPLAGGTMTGQLNAPSLNATGAVTGASVTASGQVAAGTMAIGGGTPITEVFSMTEQMTVPEMRGHACITMHTAALAGFTPGTSDAIVLGIPASLASPPDRDHDVFLTYQAWETNTNASPTITIQICSMGDPYRGGASGLLRIDVIRH